MILCLYLLSACFSWLVFRGVMRRLKARLSQYMVQFHPQVEGVNLYDACRFETLKGMATISSLTQQKHTTLKDTFWELSVSHILGPSPTVRRMQKRKTIDLDELVHPQISLIEHEVLQWVLWTVKLMHLRSVTLVIFVFLVFLACGAFAFTQRPQPLSMLGGTLCGLFPVGYLLAILEINIVELKAE